MVNVLKKRVQERAGETKRVVNAEENEIDIELLFEESKRAFMIQFHDNLEQCAEVRMVEENVGIDDEEIVMVSMDDKEHELIVSVKRKDYGAI